MRKIVMTVLALALSLSACPFDEERREATVEAYRAVEKALESGAYARVTRAIETEKVLYLYFEETFKEPLYRSLLEGARAERRETVMRWLKRSLVLEIRELLEQSEGSFGTYQKARLLLVKTKKHLKVLAESMEKTRAEEGSFHLKQMLKSLGNPGIMGVGARPADRPLFLQHKNALLELIG